MNTKTLQVVLSAVTKTNMRRNRLHGYFRWGGQEGLSEEMTLELSQPRGNLGGNILSFE